MKYIASIVFGLLLIPNVSFASSLSQSQIDAIIGVLTAFNVDIPTIDIVRSQLIGTTTPEVKLSVNTNPVVYVPPTPVFGAVTQAPVETTTPVQPVTTIQPEPIIIPTMPTELPTETVKTLEGYKFINRTGAPIGYTKAVVKIWKEVSTNPLPNDVSVEVYLGENLVSTSGQWSTAGHLVAGTNPFTLDSAIGLTEATATTIEVPVDMKILKTKEQGIRLEAHADNYSINNGNRYIVELIELK